MRSRRYERLTKEAGKAWPTKLEFWRCWWRSSRPPRCACCRTRPISRRSPPWRCSAAPICRRARSPSSRRSPRCCSATWCLASIRELLFVYLSVALTVLIGWAVARRKSAAARSPARRSRARSCSSSLTNFGMWLMMGYYPKTLAGLGRLLRRGDPVLPEHGCRRPVLRALLFGGFALAERAASRGFARRRQPQPA